MARKRKGGDRPRSTEAPGAGPPATAAGTTVGGTSPGPATEFLAGARATSPVNAPVNAPVEVPAELVREDWTMLLLALMMFLTPALGVPHEHMLQDTLKSAVVAITALGAAFALLWQQRSRVQPLRWHGVLWLPLLLMAYALGSMAWSHTYLAGVEAVRWFIFALLLWLALNTAARDRLPWLAWGIHGGALVASFWAALQFWTDFDLFPQGPNPASTFINRNFFAEFVVCTLPFSALLLARARTAVMVVTLAASTGLVITTILMTGTRSALIALWLQLLLLWPFIAWRCGAQLPMAAWPARLRLLAPAVLLGTVLALGFIPSSNPKILVEERGATALDRGFKRTQSISPRDESLGVRMVMWRATLNLIQARPLAGVGAGAWENDIPLYQAEGSQLETDYYVHNEFLHLVAEYGLVAWAFLLGLVAYLLQATWRTWQARDGPAPEEAPWRAALLCSLLVLMVVSNIGFPWRMASTGALFALCLGALAASDARLGAWGAASARPLRWSPAIAKGALAACAGCIALALYITQRASEAEHRIVAATKIALTISASNDPDNVKWNDSRKELLRLMREGVAINPHYRKITPMAADELARWGDWSNATWIWESVLSSRPNVVAIISNVARGYAQMGQPHKALEMLAKAKKIQPRAPAVRSLEVILLSRAGQEAQALALAKEALNSGLYDFDMVNAVVVLSWRQQEWAQAERALRLRMQDFPESRAAALVQLGNLYDQGFRDMGKAQAAFNEGWGTARDIERPGLRTQIPNAYFARIPERYQAPSPAAPASAAAPPQRSASSR